MGKSFWISDDGQTGNFTHEGKDTFDPSKHYIGIRLQQGVPLLDRDWNELEDIRRYEEMMLRRLYIGDVAPNDGFKITKIDSTTDFQINEGMCLIDGFEAVNESKINYSNQKDPITGNALPPLTLPAIGTTRVDVVYIHLWVREEKGITNKDVGTETCIRHKIEWLVKVKESKLEGGAPDYNYDRGDPQFHHYYNIAEIHRNGPSSSYIKDLRKRPLKEGLTVDKDYNVGIGTRDPGAKLHVVGDLTVLNGNVGIGTIDPEYGLHIKSNAAIGPFGINDGGLTISGSNAKLLLVRPELDKWPQAPGQYFYGDCYYLYNKDKEVEGGGKVGILELKTTMLQKPTPGEIPPISREKSKPLMTIDSNGNLWIAGQYSNESDIRLKENIKPLTSVLDKLAKVRGISFEWNSLHDPDRPSRGQRQIGLIAQELEEVFPELVAPSGREDYKGIQYNGMVPILVEAVKELKKSFDEIKELKLEITLLKERLGIDD